ncbi:UDP-2,4-diacetamido-2,4,6-trideoxy-beta-L-altropyranose hydrolase [Paraglaciecola sp.]|uniref:UDP-2,4-diacetamido-2,4, 6-trideoxy-beta-L-altropyranose hydrolase n=1 Tax=Paraglaciecola sp. TaxID=1920173 RepID=UPI003EF29DC9
MMRVVFRVEGEPSIGLGHIMRCLALAQQLVSEGHQVIFIMSSASQLYCEKRSDWVGEVIPLPPQLKMDNQQEAQWLNSQCVELAANWIILDGYQFDHNYRKALVSENYQFAVFDDINDSGLLHCQIVINGAANASQLNYAETAPDAILAIGKDFQVLRQEFLFNTVNNWSQRQHLTLMFGGSDPKNMTITVLQSLAKLGSIASFATDIPIVVITGAAFSRLAELDCFINTTHLNVKHIHDCQDMADILKSSRLALSAAGGSQFELLACNTPSILVVVAENQTLASQHAATQGWCQVINGQNVKPKLLAELLANQCVQLWQQPELLHSMHQQAVGLPVQNGAKNIVSLMSDNLASGGLL